jgi:predicted  nucleic acid-binding Zn-ribbon protein
MSCMEHTCLDCGHMVFDNNPKGICPKCCGQMMHQWDEQLDYERESDDEDDTR